MFNLLGILILSCFNLLLFLFYKEFQIRNIKLSWLTLAVYMFTSVASMAYALMLNPLTTLIYVFPFYLCLFHLYAKVMEPKIRVTTKKDRMPKWKVFSRD